MSADTIAAPREVEAPARLFDTLIEREAALAKRCRRLRLPAPVVTVTRRWLAPRLDANGNRYLEPMFAYTVTGDRPALAGGWQVIAVVEHYDTGNIVKTNPQFAGDAPTDLLNAPSTCEHCGHNRRRKHTVVIQNALGNRYRVGKACLLDFTGHNLPAVWETFSDDLTAWDDERLTARAREHEPVERVVAVAVAVIERHGWAPSDAELSTRKRVSNCLSGVERVEPTAEQRDAARDALQWIASTPDTVGYIANLRSAVLADAALDHLGLVVSLPRAYAKHVEQQQRAEQRAAEHRAPCPTGRLALTGVVVAVDSKDTDWGTRWVITFRDDRGFAVWGSLPTLADLNAHTGIHVGDRLTFTATVEPSERDNCFGFYKRPTKAIRHSLGEQQ